LADEGIYQRERAHSREKDIVNHDGGDQQREQREQKGAEEELLHIVVTRVNAVPKDVVLLASKEVEEGRQDSELPVVNRGRDQVKDPDVEEEKGKEVLKQRHNHGCTQPT